MKIAFLAAANSPHAIKWANALSGKGHEVTVLSMPDHKDEYNEMDGKISVRYLSVPASANGAKKNAKEAAGLLSGYDAVCAMDMAAYGLMAAKAKAQNVLLISTGRDIFDCAKNGTKPAVVKAIKGAAAVCATAPNIISKIQEYFKKEKAFIVTPFGVDMELFGKKDVQRDGGKVCIGSIKFLEPGNGLEASLEAFAKFLGKFDGDAVLKVVGSGSLEGGLRSGAQQMGIADKVEFAGYVKNADMPGVINTMDIVLQMTPEESFGVSAIEAMACEVPLVATETNGASEYVLNGVTGYLVKAGNTDAASDRLAELAKKPDARRSMGRMCREDVLPLYDLKACADKFELAVKSVAR